MSSKKKRAPKAPAARRREGDDDANPDAPVIQKVADRMCALMKAKLPRGHLVTLKGDSWLETRKAIGNLYHNRAFAVTMCDVDGAVFTTDGGFRARSLGTNDTFVSSDLFAIPDLQVEIMTMGLDFFVSGPGAAAVVEHLRADGFDGGVVHGAVQGAVRVR